MSILVGPRQKAKQQKYETRLRTSVTPRPPKSRREIPSRQKLVQRFLNSGEPHRPRKSARQKASQQKPETQPPASTASSPPIFHRLHPGPPPRPHAPQSSPSHSPTPRTPSPPPPPARPQPQTRRQRRRPSPRAAAAPSAARPAGTRSAPAASPAAAAPTSRRRAGSSRCRRTTPPPARRARRTPRWSRRPPRTGSPSTAPSARGPGRPSLTRPANETGRTRDRLGRPGSGPACAPSRQQLRLGGLEGRAGNWEPGVDSDGARAGRGPARMELYV
jgi:hypothetical protein